MNRECISNQDFKSQVQLIKKTQFIMFKNQYIWQD